MAEGPQRNNTALVIIAIISLVGTVIATTITVLGNYNLERIRQEAELTRVALESTKVAQAEATPKLITLTLTNSHCNILDYYVDGNLMVSSIVPTAKVQFNVIPGEHQVLICNANTHICGDPFMVNWTKSTTTFIPSAVGCPITITLTNSNCNPLNFYVDGSLMVSSIAPKAEVRFNVIPGEHQVFVCHPNTNDCGEPVLVNWASSTAAFIGTSTNCP